MRMFWHPARRDLHERAGSNYAGVRSVLIAICLVACDPVFLPEVVMLVPDLIFGKR